MQLILQLRARNCFDRPETWWQVKDGVFGANMSVELVNDGPVTIILVIASNALYLLRAGAECPFLQDSKERKSESRSSDAATD